MNEREVASAYRDLITMIPFSDAEEVHLLLCRTDISAEEYTAFRVILSSDERTRADRFVFDSDRIRFIASHGILRKHLAAYCGVRPEALVFGEGSHGKPYLIEPSVPIQFNLSHSGSRAALAVTSGLRCGVDIEKIRSEVSDMDIAERFFCTREIQWLRSLSEPQRKQGFFRLWSVKEAILKADGKGLSIPLAEVDTTNILSGKSPTVELPNGDRTHLNLWATELNVGDGYACALAVEAESPKVRIVDLLKQN